MKTLRMLVASCALAAGAVLTPIAAHAFDQVKIMIPAGPGGGFDQAGRSLGVALQAAGAVKSLQYENKGGAGGTIGLAQFINSERANPNALAIAGMVTVGAVHLNKSPVTLANVTPIARLLAEAEVIAVPANSKFQSIQDLMAALKANPGSVAFSGGSAGGTDHIVAGLLAREAGSDPAKVNYIAYTSGAEAMTALMGGHVAAGISGVAEFLPQIRAGRLRALAVTSPQRLPDVNVPTLKEQGINLEVMNWRGVFAAPGITDAQRDALVKAVDAAVKTPQWKAALDKLEWVEYYLPVPAFRTFVDEEDKRISAIVGSLAINKK